MNAPQIYFLLNGEQISIVRDDTKMFTVREDDEISFHLTSLSSPEVCELYLEDTSLVLTASGTDGIFNFSSISNRFFSESFGQSIIRLLYNDEVYLIYFNVLAKKVTADQAKKMIDYLASHHDGLVQACFSRSITEVGAEHMGSSSVETIISTAERFIDGFLAHRSELRVTMRSRLVPKRSPFWKSTGSGRDIDPVDILDNLDSLVPTMDGGDLRLRNRQFTLQGLDVSTLVESKDVVENQILLGGLYSIRARITEILDRINHVNFKVDEQPGYESLDRLMLKITSDAVRHRCRIILARADELIRSMEVFDGVRFRGEITPRLSPYARASKVYKYTSSTLFSIFSNSLFHQAGYLIRQCKEVIIQTYLYLAK
jgi:hypothetical protein